MTKKEVKELADRCFDEIMDSVLFGIFRSGDGEFSVVLKRDFEKYSDLFRNIITDVMDKSEVLADILTEVADVYRLKKTHMPNFEQILKDSNGKPKN